MSQPFIPTILRASGLLTLALSVCHGASMLTGVGSMSVGSFPPIPDPIDVNQTYDRPAFVSDFLAINRTEFYKSASNSMHYEGVAKFGRLATRASIISATNSTEFDILYGSSLSVGFEDTITVNNYASGWLALEFEIHGILRNDGYVVGADFGAFGGQNEVMAYTANIVNEANTPSISGYGLQSQPGQELRFVQDGNDWILIGKGIVWMPFGPDGADVFFAMRARASCYEGNVCESDLGSTATIGNIKVYNQSFELLSDALVQSTSGYDYITPPGADVAAVPEPSAVMLTSTGVLVLLIRRKSRQRRMC